MIDRLSPEEIREEIAYQAKWGDDPNMVKAHDEVFTERELSRLDKPVSKEWTAADEARLEAYWPHHVAFVRDMAKLNKQPIPDDAEMALQKIKYRDLRKFLEGKK